jgi:hypothetical protein
MEPNRSPKEVTKRPAVRLNFAFVANRVPATVGRHGRR